MQIAALPLPGLLLLKPHVIHDDRGFFVETFSVPKLESQGFIVEFVQDNHSRSQKNTVRGLHFQKRSGVVPGQAKLVRCARGKIFDVVVDVRPYSKTFKQSFSIVLDDEKHEQLFIPTGFAHGFCVLSDVADVTYKVSSVYDAATETGCLWNDTALGIAWPVADKDALVSARDKNAAPLSSMEASLWQW
jgi:dTDP-4-dehydrorhamnose 3,5-epimerase